MFKYSTTKYCIFVIATLLLISGKMNLHCQSKFHFPDKHQFSSIYLSPERGSGFSAKISLVALFTCGSNIAPSVKLGIGGELGYHANDWSFVTGIEMAHKEKKILSPNILYSGVEYDDRNHYAFAYYLNHYFGEYKQTSALISAKIKDWKIKFEDDILAFPFTGFVVYDRFRTAAIEVSYKHILIGANIFTSDINGLLDISRQNKRGKYLTGHQLDSPLYVGYVYNDLIARMGWNHKTGGEIIQNLSHRKLFNTPDFEPGTYNSLFLQTGINKPYTLY